MVPAPTGDQETELIRGELAQHVRRLIGKLPRELRDPLLLAASGELAYTEIATMLGVPVGTVKWRVSEARRRVKQKLVRLGYEHV